MLANRMGGFLRRRPQLMERMRNLRGMRGMGRNMMMPGMGIGSLANMPSRDVNDLPLPDRASDIMPRDGMMPKQPPQFRMKTQMAGVPPRGSGLPSVPNPMMDMQGRRFMNKGGEAEKYPNAGLAALAKERPDVVKKILGRERGGIMDIQNFPRRSPEMLIDQLNDIIDTDSKYAESVILPNTIFRNEGYENRRKDDPFFVDIYGQTKTRK